MTIKGQDSYMAVGEGFVEVTGESVVVLTDMAVEEKAIDESAAQEAVRRAQEALRGEHLGDEEVASVQAALQKSLAQLHVKRRRARVKGGVSARRKDFFKKEVAGSIIADISYDAIYDLFTDMKEPL